MLSTGADRTAPPPVLAAAAGRQPALERSAIYHFTLKAVTEVLSTTSGDGLPIPPLLELITAYATDSRVSTWIGGIRHPMSLGVLSGSNAASQGVRSELVFGGYAYVNFLSNASLNVSTDGGPQSMCVDHSHANRVYVVTYNAVLRVENGVQSADRFTYEQTSGIVLTRDNHSLIFSDSPFGSPALWEVTLDGADFKRTVFARLDRCDGMAWSRTTARARSLLYVRNRGIARFDTEQPDAGCVSVRTDREFTPGAIDCTVSGHVIVACSKSNTIWVVDPNTGACTRLAGVEHTDDESDDDDDRDPPPVDAVNGDPLTEAIFAEPFGVAIADSEFALAVTDYYTHSIRRVPLPAYLFVPK